MMVRCSTHGRNAWGGEVICEACGAVWKLSAPDLYEPPTVPLCTCGVVLIPRAGQLGGFPHPASSGSARMICSHCYKFKRSQQGATS